MSNEEKILGLLQQMSDRLDKIESDIEDLKEGQEEIRDSVNVLVEWADKVSKTDKFPMPDVLGA